MRRLGLLLNSNLILLIPVFTLPDIITENFKFQSDSINTKLVIRPGCSFLHFKFQSDSINTTETPQVTILYLTLNSNLILLIHARIFTIIQFGSALNSNLILLILYLLDSLLTASFPLNSNLILLILAFPFIFQDFSRFL